LDLISVSASLLALCEATIIARSILRLKASSAAVTLEVSG
jgi:hypothetical protein